MKLISWNVNGIRACVRKGFLDFVAREKPDILCIQETKAAREQVKLGLESLYHEAWNSAEKSGYSGTAIFTKQKPIDTRMGMGKQDLDKEGRVITMEFDAFFLVNVYTPNSQDDLKRLDYRAKRWDPEFLRHLKKLESKKPVVFCGDLNVAHQPIDIARPKENERHAGFTIEERHGFDKIIQAGFIDTFREFEDGPGHYTWWSYRAGARKRNIGWRIDYFCVSPQLRPFLKRAWILPEVMGSDHCPIGIAVELV
jgi:exodeoxyribonuclease-3